MQKNSLNLAIILGTLLLAACGSSSDDNPAADKPAVNNPSANNPSANNPSANNPSANNPSANNPSANNPSANNPQTNTANDAFEARKYGTRRMRAYSESGNDSDMQIRPSTTVVNGKTIMNTYRKEGEVIFEYDFRSLPAGFASLNASETYKDDDSTESLTLRSYQGFHSGILLTYASDGKANSVADYGVYTPVAAIPTAGKATYNGIAFDKDERGNFTYHVDFAARNGYGNITGMSSFGDISLASAALTDGDYWNEKGGVVKATGIHGQATAASGSRFDYDLAFYGNQAEELVGDLKNRSLEGIGVHGTRGAISN